MSVINNNLILSTSYPPNRTVGAKAQLEVNRPNSRSSSILDTKDVNHHDEDGYEQESIRANSSRNTIDPNLLDRVFKLRSKDENEDRNSYSPSNLYIKTESLVNSHVNEIGIGVDVYV